MTGISDKVPRGTGCRRASSLLPLVCDKVVHRDLVCGLLHRLRLNAIVIQQIVLEKLHNKPYKDCVGKSTDTIKKPD